MTEQLAEYERFMGQAARYIKQLEAVLQWISVDEQPPTTEGDYLFYCPANGGFQEVYTVAFTVDGDWYLTDGSADVTHWMPLPPAPEKSND